MPSSLIKHTVFCDQTLIIIVKLTLWAVAEACLFLFFVFCFCFVLFFASLAIHQGPYRPTHRTITNKMKISPKYTISCVFFPSLLSLTLRLFTIIDMALLQTPTEVNPL